MSWYALLATLREASAEIQRERSETPVACPNDGEPLREGPDGEPYCPNDGWRPGGRYVGQ